MRVLMFYHSLLSDWNHGNAHFLRGIATELSVRGHEVIVYEPRRGWSLTNLVNAHGVGPIRRFHAEYPLLNSKRYDPAHIDLSAELEGADIVIVHEWNDHALVREAGEVRKHNPSLRLYFHDTHHRMVTQPESMSAYDLSNYDGVLAYGNVLRDLYLLSGRVARAWTWHEAADTRHFRPLAVDRCIGDLVWIGNWGDDERGSELKEFLFEPSRNLGLRSQIYGVRYPDKALTYLAEAGIGFGGWLANFDVPVVFARHKVTVHIPRRPYVEALPGISTIRPFEALACGIPLVCSPWNDVEHLFSPGRDYLVAKNGREMRDHLRELVSSQSLRESLIQHGLRTITARHTCGHRVDELLSIDAGLRKPANLKPLETTKA